jgi:hypothetical protein
MKHNLMLTITSLLSLLLLTFHLADDIRLGLAPAGLTNVTAIAIMVVWLYGTLALAGRRSGYIIILLGSLLGAGIPIIHMNGPHGMVGPRITASGGVFFFVWTLLAIGVMSVFSVILSARGLWSLRSGQSR